MPQSPRHTVPYHRISNGPRYDEPHQGRILGEVHVYNKSRRARSHPASDGCREVLRLPHPVAGREHVRPSGWCVPCGDALRWSPGLRVCAYARETHVSWRDAGCSAGKCAYSQQSPTFVKSGAAVALESQSFRGTRGPTKLRDLSACGQPPRSWSASRPHRHDTFPLSTGHNSGYLSTTRSPCRTNCGYSGRVALTSA